MSNFQRRLLSCLLLVAAAFAVYWPSLQNGFVWDDTALVLRDPFIRSWRLIDEGFGHFLFTDATASNFFRPIQRLTYTLDYALFGFRPWGWHLGNILLHGAAGVLLFLFAEKLVLRLGRLEARARRVVPLLAALAWIVHPVHTSAVCYVSGRADLLAALFGFAALLLALRSTESDHPWLRPAACVCFLGALLSKESGAMFLVIWLLLAWRGFEKTDAQSAPANAQTFRGGFRPARSFFPWLAAAALVVAGYLALRFSAEKIAPPAPKPTPVAVRPILAARAVAEYAGLLIAPGNLHMERELIVVGTEKILPAARRREYQTLLGLALIVAFAAWCRRARRDDPLVFSCLAASAVAYLPVSNIFPLNANAAEHWLYVPSAFLFLAVAVSLARGRFAKLLAIVAGIWIAALGARTCARNFDWKNQRTFFEKTIAAGGDSARMFIGLGSLESTEHHDDAAIHDFHEALKREPDQPFALVNLGKALTRKGDFARAREVLEKAQRDELVRGDALVALAVLDFQEKKIDRADLLRKAVVAAPRDWSIRKRFLTHLAERGQIEEAIRELRAQLEHEPWRAEGWSLLGSLLVQAGPAMHELAAGAYEQAAAFDVHDEDARAKLRALHAGP